MVWQPEVDEIARRREIAYGLGGPEALEVRRGRGLMTIRERIDALLDPGSFNEMGVLSAGAQYDDAGTLVSLRPSNSVIGLGRIGGRDAVLCGEDNTIRGGASDGGGSAKMGHAEHLAHQFRIPLVRLIEGAGGSVRTNRSNHAGRAMGGFGGGATWVELMGMVPVVSAAMGNVAGLPAARMAQAHFSVMTKDSVVFAGGPPVVERALGINVSKEELGGPEIHLKSGLVDNLATDERDCLDQVTRFLSYLPANVWEAPPRVEPADDPERREEALLSLIPRQRNRVYDPKKLVRHVVDRDSFFELTPFYGRSLLTGLARLDGYPVGVMANNPMHVGGAMDGPASDKLLRFVDLCDTFHLPVLSFEDEPGYMVGPVAEKEGVLRRGVRALAAVLQSSVPWCTFIVRRAYGVAAGAHLNSYSLKYAWPSGEWGSIPIEGGVAAAYRREIAAAPDPEARRRELEARHEADRSPFPRAENFGLHDLIDPRETRPVAVAWVRLAQRGITTTLGPRTYSMRP